MALIPVNINTDVPIQELSPPFRIVELDAVVIGSTAERPKGVKPFEPESWSRHFRREHGAKFHKLARHSSIIHKLQDGWDFGDVYLQARHRHPSMTAKYAEFAGVETPEWGEETPF